MPRNFGVPQKIFFTFGLTRYVFQFFLEVKEEISDARINLRDSGWLRDITLLAYITLSENLILKLQATEEFSLHVDL
jgi:hypothetical protein